MTTATLCQAPFRVTADQFDYVQGILHGYNDHSYGLFCHILSQTYQQPRRYPTGYMPLLASFIKTHYKQADIRGLSQAQLIDVTVANRGRKESGEYRIYEDIMGQFQRIGHQDSHSKAAMEDYMAQPMVNLHDGEAIAPYTAPKHHTEGEPVTIKTAIGCVTESQMNLEAMIDYLDGLWEDIQDIPRDHPSYYIRHSRYRNDASCFKSLWDMQPLPVERSERLYRYRPAYHVRPSGRIELLGGGLDTCSRQLRGRAYQCVPGLWQYHLGDSQLLLPLQAFHETQMTHLGEWLVTYLTHPQQRLENAEQLGISPTLWDACLYEVALGEALPPALCWPRENTVRQLLLEELDTYSQLVTAYRTFREMTRPLWEGLSRWCDYLIDEALDSPGTAWVQGPPGQRRVVNHTGKALAIDDYEDRFEKKAALAKHLLQGQQAAFVQALTIACNANGIGLAGHEADGLLTLAPVPHSLVRQVQRDTGLTYLTICERPPTPQRLR